MSIDKKRSLFIIFLIVGLFLISPSFARDLKIIQVSDSHVSVSDAFSTRDTENSMNVLRKTIEDINTVPNVDFVIFTGDNIDRTDDRDLKEFLKEANKLKVPYYMVIGNHEVFKSQHFTKKDYMRIVRRYSKNCRARKANYIFKKNGYVFIVVDGAKEIIPGPAGYFRKSTLAWLDKKLSKYKNDKVIIFQHFPLYPPYFNRTHCTYKVEDYINILDKYDNVISVISGHYHGNGEKMVNGVYHISTPALVEKPHYYKIIEVEYSNGKPVVYTQLRKAEF